jgi:hypothetical protein
MREWGWTLFMVDGEDRLKMRKGIPKEEAFVSSYNVLIDATILLPPKLLI